MFVFYILQELYRFVYTFSLFIFVNYYYKYFRIFQQGKNFDKIFFEKYIIVKE